MFIDVTRHAGARVLRLAVAAIAYIDEVPGGAAVHLVGGESLRVTQSPAEVEESCGSMFAAVAGTIVSSGGDDVADRMMVAGDLCAAELAPRKARRK